MAIVNCQPDVGYTYGAIHTFTLIKATAICGNFPAQACIRLSSKGDNVKCATSPLKYPSKPHGC